MACLRAQPWDYQRVILAPEVMHRVRRFGGVEPYVTTRCQCCSFRDADALHARIRPRPGAQVKQHQPLVYATSRIHTRLGIQQAVED